MPKLCLVYSLSTLNTLLGKQNNCLTAPFRENCLQGGLYFFRIKNPTSHAQPLPEVCMSDTKNFKILGERFDHLDKVSGWPFSTHPSPSGSVTGSLCSFSRPFIALVSPHFSFTKTHCREFASSFSSRLAVFHWPKSYSL